MRIFAIIFLIGVCVACAPIAGSRVGQLSGGHGINDVKANDVLGSGSSDRIEADLFLSRFGLKSKVMSANGQAQAYKKNYPDLGAAGLSRLERIYDSNLIYSNILEITSKVFSDEDLRLMNGSESLDEAEVEKIKEKMGRKFYLFGVCQANCVTTEFQSAARGTRSSPNITWKLCSAGFQ